MMNYQMQFCSVQSQQCSKSNPEYFCPPVSQTYCQPIASYCMPITSQMWMSGQDGQQALKCESTHLNQLGINPDTKHSLKYYCKCNSAFDNYGEISKEYLADESLENDEVVMTNYEDLPPNTITRNIIQNRTSETNLKNLKLLEDFPYDYEFQKNSANGKLVIVYICRFDGCGKEFLRTWNLLDHVRMHQGVKPYTCPHCLKTFTQIGNLRKHVYRHNNPNLQSRRRYKCKFCKSRFTERYNYKTHLRKKHGLEEIDNKMI